MGALAMAGCSDVSEDSLDNLTTTVPTSDASADDTGAMDDASPTTTVPSTTTSTVIVTTEPVDETTTSTSIAGATSAPDETTTTAPAAAGDDTLPRTGPSEAALFGMIGLGLVLAGRFLFDGMSFIDGWMWARASRRDDPVAPR